jgi:hypothetical protein
MDKTYTKGTTHLVNSALHAVLSWCGRLLIDLEVSGYSISALLLSQAAQLLSRLMNGLKPSIDLTSDDVV